MIWPRWAMVAALAVLFLWNIGEVGQMTERVLLLVVLMAVNFYLHGRYLSRRPANRILIMLATLADLALITGAVVLWGGFESQLFVLLYPVLFAFALVFPPRATATLTLFAVGVYVAAVVAVGGGWLQDVQLIKILLVRLVTLLAVGGLGTDAAAAAPRRRGAGQGVKVLGHAARLLKSSVGSLLAPANDPHPGFAQAYQRHSDLLKKVRLARAELRSSREQIDRRRAELLEQIPVLDEKARSALLADRDSAARSALKRRVTGAANAESLAEQIGDIVNEEQKLELIEQRLATQIESFSAPAGPCSAVQRGRGPAADQRGSFGADRRAGQPWTGAGARGGPRTVDASSRERRRGDYGQRAGRRPV